MILQDTLTVLQKELKEVLLPRGRARSTLFGLLFIIGMFGVYLPLSNGSAWLNSLAPLLWLTWVPMFIITSLVADSIAGERERHTLETLLASRLSDEAILFGKLLASFSYAGGMGLLVAALGVITVNLTATDLQGWTFYEPWLVAMILLVPALLIAIVSLVGMITSMHAASVRQASQRLSFGVLAVAFVPMAVLAVLPRQYRDLLFAAVAQADPTMAIAIGVVVAVVTLGVLLAVARARFQRNKLILD